MRAEKNFRKYAKAEGFLQRRVGNFKLGGGGGGTHFKLWLLKDSRKD
jgi:hypothetical protein